MPQDTPTFSKPPEQLARIAKNLDKVAHPVKLSILKFLEQQNNSTTQEINLKIRIPLQAVVFYLNEMERDGVIEKCPSQETYSIKKPDLLFLVNCLLRL